MQWYRIPSDKSGNSGAVMKESESEIERFK